VTSDYQPGPVAGFAPDGRNGSCPTVLIDGVEVVVLDAPDRRTVQALWLGSLVNLDPATTATPVTHPLRQADMLRGAVARLYRLATDRASGGRRAIASLEMFRANLRGYMVHQFRQGELDRDTLNQFLRRFDLETCDAPVRVHYTLTGCVEIDVIAGDGVDRSTFTVGPDLDAIDLLVDGSSEHDALVKVYPSAPVGQVTYTVSGHYDVTAPDTGDAAIEARSYLCPDLSAVRGVREDTDHFQLDVRTEVRFDA
jgi:hypothetical protein